MKSCHQSCMSYQYVLELFRPSLKLLENKIKKEDQLASTSKNVKIKK